jgi:hypothetical protein
VREYRSRHEQRFVFRHGKDSPRNNMQLGKFGRNRTIVWEFSGINTLSKAGNEGNCLSKNAYLVSRDGRSFRS